MPVGWYSYCDRLDFVCVLLLEFLLQKGGRRGDLHPEREEVDAITGGASILWSILLYVIDNLINTLNNHLGDFLYNDILLRSPRHFLHDDILHDLFHHKYH